MPIRPPLKTEFLKSCFSLMLFSLAGCILLSLVYCIPISWMTESANRSLNILESEGYYPQLNTVGSNLDNFSDALMINIASTSQD